MKFFDLLGKGLGYVLMSMGVSRPARKSKPTPASAPARKTKPGA
jgi:hypothetical protein